jgi:hypothetical protein
VSDAFYPVSALMRDRAFLTSAVVATALTAAATILTIYLTATSRIQIKPVASISIAKWLEESQPSGTTLTIDDVKKLLTENSKLPTGTKFVAYTARFADVCREKSAIGTSQVVIASISSKDFLGTINSGPKNCEIANNLLGGDNLLVTSPVPFTNIASDKKVVSVTQEAAN